MSHTSSCVIKTTMEMEELNNREVLCDHDALSEVKMFGLFFGMKCQKPSLAPGSPAGLGLTVRNGF